MTIKSMVDQRRLGERKTEMEFSVEYSVLAPPTDLNDPERQFKRLPDVAYVYATSTRRPSFHEYRELLEAAYAAVSMHLQRTREGGFRSYLFLIGPILNQAEIAKYPNYDFWGQASRRGLTNLRFVEKDLNVRLGRRRIGVMEIPFRDLITAFDHQSRANRCLIVLSSADDFISPATLDRLYALADVGDDEIIADIRWSKFIGDLCGSGHVIAQEHGQFDDLERGITLCMPLPTWFAIQ